MKKYIVFFAFSLSLTTMGLFLLANCVQDSSNAGGNKGGQSSGNFGFTPNAPITEFDSTETGNEGYGFTADSIRGSSDGSSTTTSSGECGNNNPLCKSSSVLDYERKFGTSAPITITNNDAFEDFRLGEPVNSMDDIRELRVYVKLNKTNNNRYAGNVTIAYDDLERDSFREVKFKSGKDDNARYNVWFKKSGTDYFHGFFQEKYGALILIVDSVTPTVESRDTSTQSTLYNGSIWVMQFRTTFKGKNSCNNHDQKYVFQYNKELQVGQERLPMPSELKYRCWFMTNGPYDCRTWRSGQGVDTFKDIYPDSCYEKMGTFIGLDILKAFGVNKRSDIAVHN